MAGSATITGTQNYVMGIGHPKTEATTEAPPAVFAVDPLTGGVTGLALPDGTVAYFGRVLSQSGIPFGKPSSGTMGNNGALSGLTAFLKTYSDGIYLYFPASAIAAGSAAGWYWTVMSSTTAGTVYNNTYTSGQPSKPASPTPFVTTGPGAFTGVTVRVNGPQITIAGGSMGNNGQLEWQLFGIQNNSAGTKGINPSLGGTLVSGWAQTTSSSPNSARWIARNCGAQNRQVFHDSYVGEPGYNAGSEGNISVDTSISQVVSVGMQATTATDWVVLTGHSIQLLPNA